MNDYHSKYLKYKIKYIDLKDKIAKSDVFEKNQIKKIINEIKKKINTMKGGVLKQNVQYLI